MKKIIIILISILIFIPFSVNALQYSEVNIETIFDSQIEFSDVPIIYLYVYGEGVTGVDDNASINSTIQLSEKNNYSYKLTNIYIPDDSHLFAMVDNDKTGKYDCSISLGNVDENNALIKILVNKNELPKDEMTFIPSKALEQIYGNKADNESQEPNDVDTDIIIDSDNNENKVVVNVNNKEDKKNDDMIGIIFLSIIGLTVIIAGIFVFIKCVNANK